MSKMVPIVIGAALTLANSGNAQLTLDSTKPYVYLKLDHKGQRGFGADQRIVPALWLKMVNNSSFPIKLFTYSLDRKGDDFGINFTVVASREQPRFGKVPIGMTQETGSSQVIPSGQGFIFCIPEEDVNVNWYIRTSFTFLLEPPREGRVPVQYVDFRIDDFINFN